MILKRILTLLPLLAAMLVGAKAQAVEFPIEIQEYMDDIRLVAFINQSDIDQTAQWKPAAGPPPLSIAEVLELLKQRAASNPKMKDAVLTEIELRQIPRYENYWHYVVKMRHQENGKPKPLYFVVLMNGKIIPGLREPESIK